MPFMDEQSRKQCSLNEECKKMGIDKSVNEMHSTFKTLQWKEIQSVSSLCLTQNTADASRLHRIFPVQMSAEQLIMIKWQFLTGDTVYLEGNSSVKAVWNIMTKWNAFLVWKRRDKK